MRVCFISYLNSNSEEEQSSLKSQRFLSNLPQGFTSAISPASPKFCMKLSKKDDSGSL